jgi:hypothetical protein
LPWWPGYPQPIRPAGLRRLSRCGHDLAQFKVIGANGGHLRLQATVVCGSGRSLLDYDPAANTSTVLLGPPLSGGGVVAVVPYPGQQ